MACLIIMSWNAANLSRRSSSFSFDELSSVSIEYNGNSVGLSGDKPGAAQTRRVAHLLQEDDLIDSQCQIHYMKGRAN